MGELFAENFCLGHLNHSRLSRIPARGHREVRLEAKAVLADGDWRAVRSAEENALMLECVDRTEVLWRCAPSR